MLRECYGHQLNVLNSPGASPHPSKGLRRLLEEQETPADNVCHPLAVQSDVQGLQNRCLKAKM